ncbi:3-phosphoshikimate 1-carboxyvinyltransferase [Clostridium cochlearium]|uniref:3-phosphoshikimate 1-carboxyvinyltransferase n=1 Tax=Clostridium cochlearium TaxID=1494 RepID=A0ABY0QN37_CLOCO|nr:3-phosphoshikimate 1-carboxyvinyltransferase [Clostridium cochlearium]SDL33450.1 3-phosphoshikimate 1-carboxyvinyltransferase [Clostridium cochlearium]
MNCVKIFPKKLKGSINIPPSKSLAHRAIIAAGLAGGESIIDNIVYSKDILATIYGMKNFGVSINEIEKNNNKLLNIKGVNKIQIQNNIIDCIESGSTLRFLIPIALLQNEREVTFIGSGKLPQRPLDEYYNIFNKKNIFYQNEKGNLPLRVKGKLKPGEFYLKGDMSSQFITGLMFVLPLLCGDSKIIITSKLESKAYVDLTMDILNKFGVKIENNNYKEFYIKGNQSYVPRNYNVEGDFSQGAFWLVAGAIGEEISCKNLNINSLQGDKEIINIIKSMGGIININKDCIKVNSSKLKGIVIDASEIPDLVPILAVAGTVSSGVTKIINAKRVRIKECDRLHAIACELNKIGGEVEELEDSLIIKGNKKLKGGIVDSWNDHRIAMAMAVASTVCEESLIINNSKAVEKSYPNFWEEFRNVGGNFVNEL